MMSQSEPGFDGEFSRVPTTGSDPDRFKTWQQYADWVTSSAKKIEEAEAAAAEAAAAEDEAAPEAEAAAEEVTEESAEPVAA